MMAYGLAQLAALLLFLFLVLLYFVYISWFLRFQATCNGVIDPIDSTFGILQTTEIDDIK